METVRESLYDFCRRTDRLELLNQWDQTVNGPLTARTVSRGSSRKVWWQCEKGHRWKTAVFTRTGSRGSCPYCAGKRAYPGETDLATRYPELAKQWHPRNGNLTPDKVLPGSHLLVWWQCEKGHQWQAVVKSRVSGAGCPICANRTVLAGSNDLASTHPTLVAQWHPTRNGSLTPQQVVAGNHRKVWWQCEKGHVWRASIAARAINGTGCPVCAGKTIIPGENDLTSQYPHIAAQWHPSKNDSLIPETVSPYSNRRVWWTCQLGHEWQAAVAARTMRGNGCPYCTGKKALSGFNDLATLQPKIAAQWHKTLNGNLTPEMVTLGSNKKVWWQCEEGHVWQAVVYSRCGKQKCGCPICAGTVSKKQLHRNQRLMEEIIQHQVEGHHTELAVHFSSDEKRAV